MSRIQIIKILIINLLLLLIISCSSSDSNPQKPIDSNPQPSKPAIPSNQNIIFSLDKLFSTKPEGKIYTLQLTANLNIDSVISSGTGSLTRFNRPQEMNNGVLVTPSEILLAFKLNNVDQVLIDTTYVDDNGYLIATKTISNHTCTFATTELLPLKVKIGDSGIFPTSTCSNNNTYEGNWNVSDAGNDSIFFIINNLEKDQSNTVTATFKTTYIINSNSDIISYKLVSETTSGTVFTVEPVK